MRNILLVSENSTEIPERPGDRDPPRLLRPLWINERMRSRGGVAQTLFCHGWLLRPFTLSRIKVLESRVFSIVDSRLTLNPRPKPKTLNPNPSTLHLKSQSLNRNPTSQTLSLGFRVLDLRFRSRV